MTEQEGSGTWHSLAPPPRLSAGSGAGIRVQLGDKGDGTHASKEEAKKRYAHLNADHIPDIIRYGPRIDLYETKCYTPFHEGRGALGHGSALLGGAASTSDGHTFAFGNTMEELCTKTFGHEARGDGDPLDRSTGIGRISRKPGHYSDAIAKGHGVHLLVTESSGAMSAPLVAILRALAQCVKLPDACDTTVYGSSRAAPRSFYPHHLAAISAAIVQADALALTNAAAAQNCALTLHVRNDRL